MNIQDRLIALHHIDVPWRPADMTQREGRILRQGNQNPKVFIYRYITEGSFDAYSWQLLETKQRFIADLLSGSLSEREGGDIEDTVLDYAEVKALAVGNPLVKERVEAQNELSRCLSLQKKAVESRIRMEKELQELPGKTESLKEEAEKCRKDAENYRKWKEENPPAEGSKEKDAESEARRKFREDLNNAVKEYDFMEEETVFDTYRGFSIVLPANMNGARPYVLLCGVGRYYVEMGDTVLGNLIRIDNFLEGLPERQKKIEGKLLEYEKRDREIRLELAKNENYTDRIEEMKSKVEMLDKKLGVNRE